jgi:transposase InsO family protein
MTKMKVGIDSYCFHRFFGEVYPHQTAPEKSMTMEDFLAYAKELDVDGVSLESCFFPSFEDVWLKDLKAVLDDYSRYIIAWKLAPVMAASDVEETLEMALKKTGLQSAKVRHRPRLFSDNGSAYLSKDLKRFLKRQQIEHIRGAPYHPTTQVKIECFHRSLKNVVMLQHYYSPSQLREAIADFVSYYNNQRYHELLDNITPVDVFYGKEKDVQSKREKIKRRTMALRRQQNLIPASV